MAVKTVIYESSGCIRCGGSAGSEADTGETVKVYLNTERNENFVEFIEGIITSKSQASATDTSRNYGIQYDNADLPEGVIEISTCDIIGVTCISCCDLLQEQLTAHETRLDLFDEYFEFGETLGVGYGLGALSTGTGTHSVAVGNGALENVNASGNVAVGYRAARAVTTGFENVAVGALALEVATTAQENIAIGAGTLNDLTTGNGNTAVGDEAMDSATTGIDNVAVGIGAGSTLTTGSSNVLIGGNADTSGIADSNSIVLGANATGDGSNTGVFGDSNITSWRFVAGSVNIGGAAIASAALNVVSTTKGFAPPRMTTVQKNAIAAPGTGLQVYDTTLNKASVFTGTLWDTLRGESSVYVVSDLGVATLYKPAADTDAARGTALLAAAAAAVSGETIVLGPGTYAHGATRLLIPDGVHLQMDQGTLLTNTVNLASQGAGVRPGNGSIVTGGKILGTLSDGTSQAPFGISTPTGDESKTGFRLVGVTLEADTDAFYILAGTDPCSAILQDCILISKYDTCYVSGLNGDSQPHTVDLYNCRTIVTGPSSVSSGALARGSTVAYGATVRFFGGSIKVSGATTDNYGLAVYTGGVVEAYGIPITSSEFDVFQEVTGIVKVSGCTGSGNGGTLLVSGTVTPLEGGTGLVAKTVAFTENATATTHTGTVTVPAGCMLVDILVWSTVLWTDASAALVVGDSNSANGWFTSTNLAATDLLVGERLQASHANNWGGKNGTYLTTAGLFGRTSTTAIGGYCPVDTNILGVISVATPSGTAGRTFMTVVYAPVLTSPAVAV